MSDWRETEKQNVKEQLDNLFAELWKEGCKKRKIVDYGLNAMDEYEFYQCDYPALVDQFIRALDSEKSYQEENMA